MILFESCILLKQSGKINGNKILITTTTIEFIWAICSIFVLFKFQFSNHAILVPVLYIFHNVFGWLYGAYLASKEKDEIKNMSQVNLPIWYSKYGISFGAVFCLSSLYVFTQSGT